MVGDARWGLSDVYPLAELEPRTVATEGSSPKVTIGLGLVANSCYTRDHCIAAVGLRLNPLAVVAPGIDDRHFEARRRTVTAWPFRLAWFFGRRDRLSKVINR